jgi:hypothetical protein
MRRLAGWRLEIALLLGLGLAVPALAADPPDDPDAPPKGWHISPWLQKQLDDDNEDPNPKPKPKKPAPKAETAKPAAARPTPPPDPRPVSREREEKDFLRRLAVCDELLKIAHDTHDEALERKAQQLSDRAWAVYRQRIAAIPAPSDKVETNEQAVQRMLRDGPDHGRLMKDTATSRVAGIQNDTEFMLPYGRADQ